MEIKPIAYMKNDFITKFGIPRQSNLSSEITGQIIFEKEYSNPEAFNGIEGFSHLHIIWGFSENEGHKWSPTVRPPRLGGNKRVGVFATRSPFRPNFLGLSIVKFVSIGRVNGQCVLTVSGADLMNGTPIYDIKPYLSFSDSYPSAIDGFANDVKDYSLSVVIPVELKNKIPEEKRKILMSILSQDPRPSYQNDENRIYGFFYGENEIKFRVCDRTLFVTEII